MACAALILRWTNREKMIVFSSISDIRELCDVSERFNSIFGKAGYAS